MSACRLDRQSPEPPVAVKGVIDLSNWNLAKNGSVVLRGEWEFYWKELYTYEDFQAESPLDGVELAALPGKWNGLIINDERIEGSGYATYRLKILRNGRHIKVAFEIGAVGTAYEVEIDGTIINTMGVVGKSADTSKPYILSDIVFFESDSRVMEVVLRVSNFDHREGGPWDIIRFGIETDIFTYYIGKQYQDFFILGMLFVTGLSFAGLFSVRRSDRSYLYFCLFCFAIALRTAVQGGVGYLLFLFPKLEWSAQLGIEYATVYSASVFFMLFIYSLFPDRFYKIAIKILGAISAVLTILLFLLPTVLSSRLISIYQYIILYSCIHIVYIIVRNCVKKDKSAGILLVGCILFFATVINDVFHSKELIQSTYLVSYGLLLFILFQGYVLTLRFFGVYAAVDRQKRQLLKTNGEHLEEIDKRIAFERDLKVSNENLIRARSAIIFGLAKIAEYRDSDTGSHLKRIQEYNDLLAGELSRKPEYQSYISDEYLYDLYQSSILHDIGKVAVPDSILLKPGKLTVEEFEVIKMHPVIGGDTIRSIEKNILVQTFLTLGKDIAYMHHEKWNGTGYPNGIAGTAIPLSARITALSDVYDALTTVRSYKQAFSHEKAVEIITEERGVHFDPDIVDSFLAVHKEFRVLRNEINDD